MKTIFIVILLLITNLGLSQAVSYETFNSDLLNKKVLIEINKLRRGRGLDTLVPSISVYNIYSKQNCIFYYPSYIF